MKKRTTILILTACFLFYSSIFLKDICITFLNPFNEAKKQYVNKFKKECENIMFEIFMDLEEIICKVAINDKTESEDVNKKFEKLNKNFLGIKKTNSLKEMSLFFNSFCSIAETIEYAYSKKNTHREINEKYQIYIEFFYFELEFVKNIPD
jgi:hypothetical protein